MTPEFTIGIGANIRKSAYYEATLRAGVRCFSVYNHMFIPAHFGNPEAEYQRLIDGVVMWDVAAQRQVEIADARQPHQRTQRVTIGIGKA